MRQFGSGILAAAMFSTGLGDAAGALTVQKVLDCGAWVHARRAHASQPLQTYVIGMINGLSISSGREFWSAEAPVRTEDVFRWIDARCRTHPLSDLDLAIADMFEDRVSPGER